MKQAEQQFATFAGGCFWCLEAVFEHLPGVQEVVSGYTGGDLADPDYDAVCSGRSGHAEAVRIEFDPARTSYEELLRIFFAIHDPTTLNRQGNDVGSQYRSAIYWHDPGQREMALNMIAALEAEHVWPDPIVTEIVEAGRFYPAEAWHQHYFARNPEQGYCQFVIAPKLARLRAILSGNS